jgi:hypothetical protein
MLIACCFVICWAAANGSLIIELGDVDCMLFCDLMGAI